MAVYVRTGVGISGSLGRTGYETNKSESSSVANSTTYLQQARAVLRVTPTYVSGRFFIQAQAELVGNGCQTTGTTCPDAGTVSTDDLGWYRGVERLDLKVGRFEGWRSSTQEWAWTSTPLSAWERGNFRLSAA